MRDTRGLLFIGGEAPERDALGPYTGRDDAYVIAADSGLETALRYGIEPDLIIGDMDSLSDLRLLAGREARTIRYPVDKDETDTEIGLDLMRNAGLRDITIIGGGGGRLDHEYALFMIFERDFHPTRWFSRRSGIRSIDTSLTMEAPAGTIVSFFPVGQGPWSMISTGLVWPLDSLRWKRGDFGISNRFAETRVSVTMRKGRIIAIHDLSLVVTEGD